MKKIFIIVPLLLAIFMSSCSLTENFEIFKKLMEETTDICSEKDIESENCDTEAEIGSDTESETESETQSETELETEKYSETEITTDKVTEKITEKETEKEIDKINTTSGFDFSIAPDDDGKITVLLDAGHGFDDPGCTSPYINGMYEKDITLDTVYRIKNILEARGCNVLMTHDGKTFPNEDSIANTAKTYGITYKPDKFITNNVFSAYERTIYSDILCIENDVDLMVSIHVNANPDSNTVTGFMLDYCGESDFSELSKNLMGKVSRSLKNDFPGTGLVMFADSWDDAFIVTKYVLMPSILIEMGYASTPSDAEKLVNSEWRDSFALSVANGICDFVGIS